MNIVAHRDQPLETWRAGVETRMQVSAASGATQLCIFEQWVAPGAGAPPHSHPVEEVLTVIAGEARMSLDGGNVVMGQGQSLVVPAGHRHGFQNVGSDMLHIHAVLASPIFEATFDGTTGPVRRWLPVES